jgi:endonuclease/exonuclease/phosphatase family metal-dependent hydrolase
MDNRASARESRHAMGWMRTRSETSGVRRSTVAAVRRLLVALAVLASGCSLASPAPRPEAPSRVVEIRVGSAHPPTRWLRPAAAAERAALDAWFRGVGPALFRGPAAPAVAGSVDSLVIVVWNVNVGGGSLERLLNDLRGGELTNGQRPGQHVLLLQEVHRAGAVPELAPQARAAERIAPPPADGERIGIDAIAERNGLFLYYVPSMRNGAWTVPSEDRGNAILSTLPLSDPVAVELPLERQRRVAITARVSGRTSDGEPWSLRLVNAHLDPVSSGRRFLRSFGAGRVHQVRHLLSALPDEGALAVGGDFNTWLGGAGEEAIALLRKRMPLPALAPTRATALAPLLLPDRVLDHLFFRLPEGWHGDYRVIDVAYGSDHRPLVGRVLLRRPQ